MTVHSYLAEAISKYLSVKKELSDLANSIREYDNTIEDLSGEVQEMSTKHQTSRVELSSLPTEKERFDTMVGHLGQINQHFSRVYSSLADHGECCIGTAPLELPSILPSQPANRNLSRIYTHPGSLVPAWRVDPNQAGRRALVERRAAQR